MKRICAIIGLVLMTNLSQANSLSPNNEMYWEKGVEVENNSVIAKEGCSGSMQLTLDSPYVTHGDLKVNFSINTSPDDKYYIIRTFPSCKKDAGCISSEHLVFSPKTSATLSCWKYQGMTVSMGDDGNLEFDSDNPVEKELILKALAHKK